MDTLRAMGFQALHCASLTEPYTVDSGWRMVLPEVSDELVRLHQTREAIPADTGECWVTTVEIRDISERGIETRCILTGRRSLP